METIDLFFRFAAIGVLALLAAAILKTLGGRRVGALGALFSLGIAAYLVSSSPELRPHLGGLRHALLIVSVANPVVFYLFSRALFDDDFRFEPWHGVVLVGLEVLVHLHRATFDDGGALPVALGVAHWAVALGLVLLALVQAIRGRIGDLVEERRRFRVVFVAVVGAYMILVMGSEIAQGASPTPPEIEAANAGAILVVSAVIALYVFSVRSELFGTIDAAPLPVAAATPIVRETSAVTAGASEPTDPAEQRLIDALQKAMAVDRLYRQEGLTIAALAAQLGTQEHRLRRVINRRLGHRNFAAFLNRHRIAEVSAALSDPAKAHLPVLTIAMDAGYRSLGPFNQAFKQTVGMTPTEFRRSQRADGPASPPAT